MANGKRNPNVKVIPVRDVVHTRFSDLIGVRGHPHYFVNLLSGKITYIEKGRKIPTGVTGITEAKNVVLERLKMDSGETKKQARRSRTGVSNIPLSEAWAEMIELRKVEWEESTIDNYMTNWRNAIAPFWGKKLAMDVHEKNIHEFKSWYLREKPTRYFGHTLCHFGVFLDYLKLMGHVRELPSLEHLANVDEITTKNRGKEWQSGDKVFSVEEQKKLFEVIPKLKTERDRSRATLGILLGVRNGLRKMEAMKMRWSEGGKFAWVDFKNNLLHVWSYKNHKWREVPLLPEIKEALLNQKCLTDSVWVFPMPTDPERHISSQLFDKVWVKCKALAGVVGRFHDLRHTFATFTAEAGWPPVVACSILDMSLRIYQHKYAKPSRDSKAKWMLGEEDDD